jgi:hypothetical protein
MAYTPDEILAVRQRAEAAIRRVDEMVAERQARQLGLIDEPQQTRSWPPPPREDLRPRAAPTPEPVEVEHRPHGPRDWAAEAVWITGIAKGVTAEQLAALIEGIGEVLADERKAMRAEFEHQLEVIRRDVERRLDRLSVMVEAFSKTELCAWPVTTTTEVTPH